MNNNNNDPKVNPATDAARPVDVLVMRWPWDTFPEDLSTWEVCRKEHTNAIEKQERQLAAILSFIDEGSDELLIRRIWERALRA